MSKLVVFNALQTSLSGGIGRYSYELSKALYLKDKSNIKIVIREEDLNLFKFANKDDLIIAKNINNSQERNIYEQFELPKVVYKKYPNAIIHYPDTMAPIMSKNKVVITVHDLAFKSLKNVFTWKTTLWKSIITRLSISKANKIIAITEFTKCEILKYYSKINNSKIGVIYNGFNDFSGDKIHEYNVRKNLRDSKSPYILTVSTISPRKNIGCLIRAFNEIKDKIDQNLVIAGNNGWMYQEIYALVKSLNLEDRVIFLGKVNDDELKFLYKNANCFVYPSYYEGFGLPPLEALSFGVKCILSDIDVFREVYGDEVEYFNPMDYIELSNKILSVDKQISKPSVVGKYEWDKCAKEVLEFYQNV